MNDAADALAYALRAAASQPRPARPRLDEALAVVTNTAVVAWTHDLAQPGARLVWGALGPRVESVRPGETRRDSAGRVGSVRAGYAWSGIVSPLTITDPAEAWEALAARGLIPAAWVDCAERRFACSKCSGDGGHVSSSLYDGERAFVPCRACGVECDGCAGSGGDPNATGGEHRACWGTGTRGRRWFPHPATVADCVAFAADVAGVLRAEEILRARGWREGHVGARLAWRVERVVVGASAMRSTPRALLDLGYALAEIDDDGAVLLCPPLEGA